MDTFSTIKEIIDYVKPRTEQFKQYPSKKSKIIEELRPIFQEDATPWGLVIEYNKFVPSFRDALGKKRRVALKKLLYELDYNHYKDVDFDID